MLKTCLVTFACAYFSNFISGFEMPSKLKLYGSFTSPYVRHCRIALLESNLACEFSEADTHVSAKLSPMQKVPFLSYEENGEKKILTDSAAILKLIREQHSNSTFMSCVDEFNDFCAANTLLDSALNLFFIEKDGITAQQSSYLQRQQNRIQSALAEFEKKNFSSKAPFNDFEIRLACALDWALFRKRIRLQGFPNLHNFLNAIKNYQHFSNTQPPDNM